MTLDSLHASLLLSKTTTSVGDYGETIARSLFEGAGYTVQSHKVGTKNGDLRVILPTGEFKDIDVKTSRKGKRLEYQACLRRDARKGSTAVQCDVSHVDYVLLLLVGDSGRTVFFLIPVGELGQIKKICIRCEPDKYNGKYAKYRLDDSERVVIQ